MATGLPGYAVTVSAATTLGGSYAVISGIDTVDAPITAETVDTTAFDDGQWRTFLKTLMSQDLTLSGTDVQTGTGYGYIKAAATSASGIVYIQITWDGTNGFKGSFIVTSWKQGAKVGDKVTLEASLKLTGAPTDVP